MVTLSLSSVLDQKLRSKNNCAAQPDRAWRTNFGREFTLATNDDEENYNDNDNDDDDEVDDKDYHHRKSNLTRTNTCRPKRARQDSEGN